jgi:Transposase
MAQSSTLCIGMDVHTDAIAVASVAQEHGAEVTSLGIIGTRPCDIDQLIHQRPSKAKHRIFVSEAGPCGYGLSRSLTKKDDDCWVVAPSLIPQKAGDRVTTDRRDAVPWARLARSGELPLVDVPTVEDAAMRALTRAREDTLSDLKDAKLRLTGCLLRKSYQRCASGAADSRSGAQRSGGCRPSPARRGSAETPPTSALTPGCSPCSTFHAPSQCLCAGLLEHLVRKVEQMRGQRQAEGLGRLEVDDELKLHGLFHRQVGGLGSLQNLIDVCAPSKSSGLCTATGCTCMPTERAMLSRAFSESACAGRGGFQRTATCERLGTTS